VEGGEERGEKRGREGKRKGDGLTIMKNSYSRP